MGNSRDDFTSATKELLANRVGRRCSNPACRKLTCGANTNPEKITNIGVAAHICAAAQGGPRYDASMTPEERKSFENGIWLCQSCSKLIDTDITRYPKELLQSWKQLAEQTAILEVETTSSTPAFEKDKELVQFYLECFDRPAFQDDIYQEGRMEDFDKAIEDTLIALNTGVLRTRDGSILKQADGKSSVQNSLWECTVPTAYAEKYAAAYNTSNLRNISGNQTILRIIGDRPPMENVVRVQPTLEDLYLFYFKGGCEE